LGRNEQLGFPAMCGYSRAQVRGYKKDGTVALFFCLGIKTWICKIEEAMCLRAILFMSC
jgi:hypothetical protein